MSKQNKVNKNNYTQAGRLTPDDMARERQKQTEAGAGEKGERIRNRAGQEPRTRGEQGSSRPRSAPEE